MGTSIMFWLSLVLRHEQDERQVPDDPHEAKRDKCTAIVIDHYRLHLI